MPRLDLLAQERRRSYKSWVRLAIRVASVPTKPVLIYDGDCNFCRVWVHRWRLTTDTRVDYLPFQDIEIGRRFPELPRESFETAVHLIETDGSVFQGAEAAFRALGHAEREPLLLDWYLRWPSFRTASEACYGFIARHRRLFSVLTRFAWGENLEPSSYVLVRAAFLKGLGLIYLIAFLSLWSQLSGLVGSNGILPASLTMFGVRQEANLAHIGWQRYELLPTLCWLSASDSSLQIQCAAGAGLALLLILGIAPSACSFLLWLLYLSLSSVSREFLSFQWDVLLLEAGFLAVFFAPLQWLPKASRAPPPSKVVLWLFRWLLFRLMLGSGLVKLLSSDPAWRNLTALKYHYETQPLPTWIGWYAHQMPLRVQQISTLIVFSVELALPFLIFAPRRLRRIPCIGFVLLQALILLTGNYCFFNLLTILLCVLLLDDTTLRKFVPARWRDWHAATTKPETLPSLPSTESAGAPATKSAPERRQRKWPIQFIFPLTCMAILIPIMQSTARLHLRIPWPAPLRSLFNWVSPLRSFNTYGLFEVMTTNRLEIVLQGSNDGANWLDYEFKYKPGDVKRRPGFVEPHQPRLDWQMWFAVFGDYRQNPWFVEFCARVMNGSPQVLSLLGRNPFPQKPPRYLRAVVYEYHFTNLATRRRTGAWWTRELKGLYLPMVARPAPQSR